MKQHRSSLSGARKGLSAKLAKSTLLFGLFFLLAAGGVTGWMEFRYIQNRFANTMSALFTAVGGTIDDSIFQYGPHLRKIQSHAWNYPYQNIAAYLNRELKLPNQFDTCYLLGAGGELLWVSPPYGFYAGQDITNLSYVRSKLKVSHIHQSFFHERPVISLRYPLPGGRALFVDRDLPTLLEGINNFNGVDPFGRGYFFVLGQNGAVALHPDKELVRTRYPLRSNLSGLRHDVDTGICSFSFQSVRFICYRQQPDQLAGWTIYYAIPYSAWIKQVARAIGVQVFWVVILLTGVLALFHFMLFRHVSRPVANIAASLEAIEAEAEEASGQRISPRLGQGIREFLEIIEAFNRVMTKLNESRELIRINQQWLQTIFETAQAGIMVIDAKTHTIIDINPTGLAILGGSKDQILGRKCFQFVCESPEGNCPITDLGQEMDSAERTMLSLDGQEKITLKSATMLELGGEELLIETFIDISEAKKLQAQLVQAQKMEAVGTLASGIAHDFNNILQAISGYTELACDESKGGKDNTHLLDNVLKSAERAKELVKQILTFSRKAEADMKPVDISKEVSATVQLIERTIPKMISIELHLDQGLRLIKGDPNQIEQVLLNLASNAKDAMPGGGKLIIETNNVTLGEEYTNGHLGLSPGDYVQLTVSDTGHGIYKDTLDHIFDPFYTTKELGKGTGLGLASAYGIVKSHGGEIICYSEPGSGATFKIYLPVDQQDVPPSIEAPPQPLQLPGGKETILLVDDEDALRDLGWQTLSKAGYSVITAESGEEALDVYRAKIAEIDLVIMDLSMPGMGGHEALKAILEVNPGAKVMIASGYAANGSVKGALQAGAVGYVAKPFLRAELLTVVRNVLDKS